MNDDDWRPTNWATVIVHRGWEIRTYRMTNGVYVATCWRGGTMFNVEGTTAELALERAESGRRAAEDVASGG